MGIVQKSGNSYKYNDLILGRGYGATRQFLKAKENKKMTEEILKLIRKTYRKQWLCCANH